jgi:hypothetical protein
MADNKVMLEGILLKPAMVTPGTRPLLLLLLVVVVVCSLCIDTPMLLLHCR